MPSPNYEQERDEDLRALSKRRMERFRGTAGRAETLARGGVPIEGGMIRAPQNAGEWARTGAELAGQLTGAKFGGKLLGPLANYVSAGRFARAAPAITSLGRIAGSAGGGAASSGALGQDPTAGAIAGALGEAGGQALQRPVNALGQLLSSRVLAPGLQHAGRAFPGLARLTKLQPGTDATLRILADEAGSPSPTLGQVTESDFVRRMQSALEGAFGSRGVLERADERANVGATARMQRFVDNYVGSATREQRGDLIDLAVKDGTALFRRTAEGLYSRVDRLNRRAVVDLEPVKNFLANKLEREELAAPDRAAIEGMMEQLMGTEGQVTFQKASNIRSWLLERARKQGDKPLGDQEIRYANAVARRVEHMMELGARTLGPDGWQAYRKAANFYGRGATDLNDKALLALVNRVPEDAAAYILRSGGKTRTSLIDRLSRITSGIPGGREAVIDPLRAHYLTELIGRTSSGQVAGGTSIEFVDGLAFAKNLRAMDDRSLGQLFGRKSAAEFRTYARALEQAQARASAGSSSLTKGMPSMQLLQMRGLGLVGGGGAAGAALGVYLGDKKGGAIGAVAGGLAVILGPRALAQFLANPSNVRMLSDGALAPVGTKAAANVAGQFMARMLDLQRLTGNDQVRIARVEAQPQQMPGSGLPLPNAFRVSPESLRADSANR